MLKILLVIICALLLMFFVLWLIGERGKLLMSSTNRFIQTAGIKRFLNFSTLHGYIYLRIFKQYLKFLIRTNPTSHQSVRKFVANRYHSKVLTNNHARRLITLDKDIPYQEIEQIVPYKIARSIVMKAPPKIAAFECACRHSRPNPCLPTQVCLFIGELYADFMLEHHPKESQLLTQTEALKIIDEEHERGHIHSAWFKDATIDRFYAICNCCKCCCGGIETMVKYGIPIMASSGYVAQSDDGKCKTCGTCVNVCPFNALSLNQDHVIINWNKCMGCGVCVDKCTNKVLSLVRDEKKGVPLEVDLLTTN